MKNQLSIQELLLDFKKNAWLSIVGIGIGVLISVFFTFFIISPKYSSQVDVIPNQLETLEDQNSQSYINAELQMINTYKVFIKSNFILTKVNKEYQKIHGESPKISELKKMIDVVQTEDSQIFSIKVTSDDPVEARDTANITAQIFAKEVPNVISKNKITIISDAAAEYTPISPNKKINIMAGAFIGFLITTILTSILSIFGNKIQSPEEIKEKHNFVILGEIPFQTKKRHRQIIEETTKFFSRSDTVPRKKRRREHE
ncbi:MULTISPECIES: YveK family protein [unclassified Enterococcus]|jgi:capsular polysaccharide biosynthesis protein|uniref:YveK family protein n=1 Tax=unclassified Enterococcus TaxID=2608891 RepID=UPI003D2CFCA4